MADIKHIEYCIKLGNTLMQDKLESYRTGKCVQPQINNVTKPIENVDFRQRLRNWNT